MSTSQMSSILVFPIFAKQPDAGSTNTGAFRWINPPIGPKKSCLHGIHLEPKATTKIAAFDLDGCLIESTFKGGRKVKSDSDVSFTWWRSIVPKRLKQLHEDG
jgi:bifunctional polynucleotide phosphatase/kinase